jgi:hypothetical protein
MLTVASTISVLLCAATIALWVRTYWREYDMIYVGAVRRGESNAFRLDLHRGLMFIGDATTFVRPGRETDFERALAAIDATHQFGWRVECSDAVAYSGPRALIAGLWKFEVYSGDLRPLRSDPADTVSYRHVRTVWIPLWVIVLTFAVWPGAHLLVFWRVQKQRRRRPNACRHCGYDLRASPERCPECGSPLPVAPQSGAPSG